jgi:uncharacterized protein (DUF1697 family)
MPSLRALVEELGGEQVATYLQSGNVVFASRRAAPTLRRALETALERDLGIRAAVLLRTRAELRKLTRANPYADRVDDPRRLHVIFLEAAPSRSRLGAFDRHEFAPDEFQIVGRDVFAFYPRGYARTKLTTATVEDHLGVTATSRNWRTVTAIAELASNLG